MEGKYASRLSFHLARARRAVIRAAIRRLVSWSPRERHEEGCTLIIGCNHRLAGMLPANLRVLERQDLTSVREIIAVFDATATDLPAGLEVRLREQFPHLPLRLECYSARQERIARRIGWAWVYAWMSWCIGIAQTRTRYALLHDFDAMLIRPDAIEERCREIARGETEYLGARYYEGNGVEVGDRLVTTFEMAFDAAFVRERFRPIDLFNHVCMHRGRTVDFDTFLYAQSRVGRRGVLPLREQDMVHPSQLICQFTELMNGRELNPQCSSLLLIPYLFSLGDERHGAVMASVEASVGRGGATIPFFGRSLRIAALQPLHAQWLAKQAVRLECAMHGELRPAVRSYFETILRRTGAEPLEISEEIASVQ